jgi:hypothetical protein
LKEPKKASIFKRGTGDEHSRRRRRRLPLFYRLETQPPNAAACNSKRHHAHYSLMALSRADGFGTSSSCSGDGFIVSAAAQQHIDACVISTATLQSL